MKYPIRPPWVCEACLGRKWLDFYEYYKVKPQDFQNIGNNNNNCNSNYNNNKNSIDKNSKSSINKGLSDIDSDKRSDVDCINLVSDCNSDQDSSDSNNMNGNISDNVKKCNKKSKNKSTDHDIAVDDNTKGNMISNGKNDKVNNNVGFEALQNDIDILGAEKSKNDVSNNVNVKNCNNNNNYCNNNNSSNKHKIHCFNGVIECAYFMCLGNTSDDCITCFNCKRSYHACCVGLKKNDISKIGFYNCHFCDGDGKLQRKRKKLLETKKNELYHRNIKNSHNLNDSKQIEYIDSIIDQRNKKKKTKGKKKATQNKKTSKTAARANKKSKNKSSKKNVQPQSREQIRSDLRKKASMKSQGDSDSDSGNNNNNTTNSDSDSNSSSESAEIKQKEKKKKISRDTSNKNNNISKRNRKKNSKNTSSQTVLKNIKLIKKKPKVRRNNKQATSTRQETIMRLGLRPKRAIVVVDSSDNKSDSDSEWTG